MGSSWVTVILVVSTDGIGIAIVSVERLYGGSDIDVCSPRSG